MVWPCLVANHFLKASYFCCVYREKMPGVVVVFMVVSIHQRKFLPDNSPGPVKFLP